MRLIFMGTPQFAVPALEKIHNSKHQIVMVVTAPDKPRGRGRKIGPTPIKEAAIRFGLPVLQPENLKTSTFLEQLMALNPDLNVVVAFRILPESAFSLPRHGSVNLHASLLPKYRGAAPINWAIINGETKTGLTTFLLKKQVDTGDILMQREIDIAEDDDFGSLHDKMAILGANLLMETIDAVESGSIRPKPQDKNMGTAAPKLTPATGLINWTLPASQIHNLVRGLSPVPGAYSILSGKKMIFIKANAIDDIKHAAPGTIIEADARSGMVVVCGQGALSVLLLKPEGKRVMGSAEFVRGYNVKVGNQFSG